MPEDLDFGVGEDLSSATATVGEYPIARDGGVRKRQGSVQRGHSRDDVRGHRASRTLQCKGRTWMRSEARVIMIDHQEPFGSGEAVQGANVWYMYN
jgi:hypothetical protein